MQGVLHPRKAVDSAGSFLDVEAKSPLLGLRVEGPQTQAQAEEKGAEEVNASALVLGYATSSLAENSFIKWKSPTWLSPAHQGTARKLGASNKVSGLDNIPRTRTNSTIVLGDRRAEELARQRTQQKGSPGTCSREHSGPRAERC